MNSIIKDTFNILGGDRILMMRNRCPRVIFWHGVADNIQNQAVEAGSINIEVFNKQIRYLNSHYEIISIEEFDRRFKTNSFSNKEIVLTFDDGYLNNLKIVTPILNSLNLPFTVFISTEHISTGEFFPTSIARLIIEGANLSYISVPSIDLEGDIADRKTRMIFKKQIISAMKSMPVDKVRQIVNDLKNNISLEDYNNLCKKYPSMQPMNWDEVKKIHNLGATIGSHCKYHICCHCKQDEKEVHSQIIDSKKRIEEELSAPCYYFAYPNGDYTEFSKICINEAGYSMGFTTEYKNNILNCNNSNNIPRIAAMRDFSTFKIITNLYPKDGYY